MMKIAYLILAHNQPRHLFRMIQALDDENVSFYIHIDLASDIRIFQNLPYGNNVHFIKDRVMIHHGGFSQVRGMLNLMNIALQNNETQYFITLSGWDYPIKNNLYINDYLSQSYPMNFINFYPLVGGAEWVNNIRKYHFIDFIGLSPHFLQKPLKACQFLLRKSPLLHQFIPGMLPYRGSGWFCLNKETLKYMMDFLKSDEGKNYFNYFKWVSCADEIFFQTIILNSPYAKFCRYYERDIVNAKLPAKNENKAYLHYIDWDPARENPAQFDMHDFDSLMHSEALFARKFNQIKSRELLDAIDQQIGNQEINLKLLPTERAYL